MCTPVLASLKKSKEAVARVALPSSDPVYGEEGPLLSHWT
jgi:uncharacterized protein YjlB